MRMVFARTRRIEMGTAWKSRERLKRLRETGEKGMEPTSQGNRKIETSSGGMFHSPNKFKKQTEPASSVKDRRKSQRESD
jgi:hypothetical protein